jgi:serine/threonine protein kinase
VGPDNGSTTVYLDQTSLEKRFPKISATEFPKMMKAFQAPTAKELHATIQKVAPNISVDQLHKALLATKHITSKSPDQIIPHGRGIPRNIICVNGRPYLQLNHTKEGDKVIAKTTKNVRYCLGLHDNKLYAIISAHTNISNDLDAEVPCLKKMRDCENIVQSPGNTVQLSNKYGMKKHYLIETLYTGGTLKDPMDAAKKLPMAKKLTKALDAMHQRGIIHRDIKPDNIFLSEQGEPHIGDFGASCHVTGDENRKLRTGGTVPYMAPEFARAHLSRPKMISSEDFQDMMNLPLDVYGMGCVLYELFIEPVTKNPNFQRLSSLDQQSQTLTAQLGCLAAMDKDWMDEPNAMGTPEERRNHIIWSMLRADPARRITAAEANAKFAAL